MSYARRLSTSKHLLFLVLGRDGKSLMDQYTAALVLSVIIREFPYTVWEIYQSEITLYLVRCLSDANLPIFISTIRTCNYLTKYLVQNNVDLPTTLIKVSTAFNLLSRLRPCHCM